MQIKKIWVTWETQRRNQSLSNALGAQLYELDFNNLPSFLRYIKCSACTLVILYREKPQTLFVQNPSLILATLAIAITKISKINVVIDAHNGGIKPLDGKSKFLNSWARFILKNSPTTIVTNEAIRHKIRQYTTDTEILVLPDPLPAIHTPARKMLLKGKFNLLFICTWATDEPYLNVIEAAKLTDRDVFIYITGNHRKIQGLDPSKLPANIVLTGFIPSKEFDHLLYSADAIMDLTTREDCLVCGAYEAISIEKPLILSKTQALQSYFPGMIYTNNQADDIAQCIEAMLSNLNKFNEKAAALKHEITAKWAQQLNEVENKLLNSQIKLKTLN